MRKISLFIISIILVLSSFGAGYFYRQVTFQNPASELVEPIQITVPPAQVKRIGVHQIPHWDEVNHQKSFQVFQASCLKLIHQKKALTNSNTLFPTYQEELKNACVAALKINTNISSQNAKDFFETHFRAYTLKHPTKKTLFTGYYAPNFEGRLLQDHTFKYPIYAKPHNLLVISLRNFSKNLPDSFIYGKIQNHQFIPYDDRANIAHGSIKDKSDVIAWVKNPMDSLELEIQGAGIIRTPEKNLFLNYAAQNGKPYQPIGKFLIQEGKIARKDMSMQSIRHYFEKHPEDIDRIFNKNPSYVFFKTTPKTIFYGYQNIPLTSGYSMAIDKSIIPMGVPIFLNTTLPNQQQFNRLMVAQDVGGAIKGPYRGDIYFGTNEKAMNIARKMQSYGKYWILIPEKINHV